MRTKKKVEDTKWVFGSHKSKTDRHTMTKRIIHKTLH